MTLLIKNGTLVDDKLIYKADILIDNEKIVKISPNISPESFDHSANIKILDASGRYIMPGFIDAHTHFHLVSRGTVTADDFENGSELAAFGGVTTVIDFSDHERGKSLTESAEDRLSEMNGRMQIDYSLHQGVYGHGFNDSISKEIPKLKDMGISALKIFTTYKETGYLLENEKQLSELFRLSAKYNMLVTAHCEYNPIIESTFKNYKGDFSPSAHAVLRPDTAESEAIRIYGEIALKENCPLYVVHTSSEKGYEEIKKLRNKGARVYMETTPTYLFLDKTYLQNKDGALYIMTPPLRDKKDNTCLQNAVLNGDVDVVASDHCTFTLEQKLSHSDVRSTFPGIPGTEEIFVLLNTFRLSNSDLFSLNHMVDLISTQPAKLFGIYPEKGSLKEGTDADLVIVDLDKEWILTNDTVHSNAKYTAYNNVKVKGFVETTILRGEIIMEDNHYVSKTGRGRFIKQNL